MKLKITLITVFCSIGIGAFAQDLRVVNGITVDLGPVHTWLASSPRLLTERPLAHWKILRIAEFKGQLAGWDQCLVRNEDGQVFDVLLAHLEPAVRNAFQQLSEVRASLKASRQQIYNDEDQLAGLPRSSSIVVSRMRAGLLSKISQERIEFGRLQQLEREAAAESEKNGCFGFLAMRTSAYGGLPVWDCGQKR
jgi:hypothetical protein